MKLKPSRFLFTSLATVAAASIHFARAADYYWDAASVTPNGVSLGGSSAWTLGVSGWEDGTSARNWANNNTAILGGTAGTLTLGGVIIASGITVQSSGYKIDGAQSLTAGLLNIGSGASLEIANSSSALIFSGLAGSGTLMINKGSSSSNISAMNGSDSLNFNGVLQLRGGSATTSVGTVASHWISLGGASVTQAAGTAFALDTGASTSNAKDLIISDSWGGKTLTLSSLSGHGSIRRDSGNANNTTIRVNQSTTTIFNGLILSHTSGAGAVRSIDFVKNGTGALTLAGLVGKQTASAGAAAAAVNIEVAGGTLVMTANNTTTGSLSVRNGALLRMENANAGSDFTGGNSSMTGNYTIDSGGEIQAFRNGTAAFGTGTMVMNGGGLFQVQGNWTWINAITLNSSTSSTIGNKATGGAPRSLKLQGAIGGSGNLTLTDPAGTLTSGNTGIILTGDNSMSGTLTVDTFVRVGGTTGSDISIAAGTGGSLGTAAVIINSGKRLTFSRSDSHTVTNTISGAGALYVGSASIIGSNTQDVTFSGTNSYTGGTELLQGKMRVNALSNIGTHTGGNTGYLAVKNGSTFVYQGSGSETTTRNLFMDSGAATIEVTNAAASLTWNDAAAKNGALTKSGAGSLVLGGAISGAGGAVSVSGGTLTLSGTSTYTGATMVSAGTLLVTGALANTLVTVDNNATIGGNGTLGGALSLLAGAKLDVSSATIGLNSEGILSVAAGKTMSVMDFGFARIVGWDWVNAAEGTYTLINGGGAVSLLGTTPTASNPFDFGNGKSGYFQEGSLQAVIIPEPRAALLGGIGLLILLRRRRSA